MSNKKYGSIMIDIVDSRKYKNRNEIQEFMKCIIVYLNKIFYKSLKKPLMFSAGDEIQGLFYEPLAAYLCVRFCMMICYPLKIRAGIGYGELAFDNENWKSSELDGEVYHNARYAIESFSGKNSFGIRINTKTKKDKYLNAMLYSSQLLQRQQSVNVQNVKLIAELLYPIFDENIMVSYIEFKDQLNFILEMKANIVPVQSLSYARIGSSPKGELKNNIVISNDIGQVYFMPLRKLLEDSNMLVENTWKKGMSTKISDILGTTRQNIDKHIRLGNINENRKIDFSVACWLIEELDNA